jgi:multiple sugar transport system substrate-binding protein
MCSCVRRFPRTWLGAVVLFALAVGCAREKPPQESSAAAPRAAAHVRLLVVDDADLSAAIEGLGAEWKARTGGTFAVSQATIAELVDADAPPEADAVIYPSPLLGTLAERTWITPLPEDYASHRELAWADTFELEQVAETCWGKVPHAVTLGSPLLVCYCRTDLLEALHKQPPQDWAALRDLAEVLAKRDPTGEAKFHAIVQPLAEGWAARVLLARAASYAKHPDHYSALFNIETMEPLVAGPGFVRALEELLADARLGPENQLEMDAADARNEFLAGRAGLAIAWPGHAGARGGDAPEPPPTTFAELPGSAVVHNFARGDWEQRDEVRRVPLLALAGRLGSIAADSSGPSDAFHLLAWLSGREWGTRVSTASPATTLYRRSQMRDPRPWVDPKTEAAAAEQYAAITHTALSRQDYLGAPRIPGAPQYMAALDAAVREAVRGDKSPAEALAAAAAEWKRITEELGVDAQRKAYRLSLGLEP